MSMLLPIIKAFVEDVTRGEFISKDVNIVQFEPLHPFGLNWLYPGASEEIQIKGGLRIIIDNIYYLSMKTCYDPSLEPSRREGSNDRSQHIF